MGNFLDVIEFDHLVGQQSQRPTLKAFGRFAATERHQVRLEIAVGFCFINAVARVPIQRDLQALFDASFSDATDLLHAHLEHGGDLFIGRPTVLELSLVATQEDQRVEDFLRFMASFSGDDFQIFTLVSRQRYLVFFRLSCSCWCVSQEQEHHGFIRQGKCDMTRGSFEHFGSL